jgi:hypothetical protein
MVVADNVGRPGDAGGVPWFLTVRSRAERASSEALSVAEMRAVMAFVRAPSLMEERWERFCSFVIQVPYTHPGLDVVMIIRDSTLMYADGTAVAETSAGCLGIHVHRRGTVLQWSRAGVYPLPAGTHQDQCLLCRGGMRWSTSRLSFCPLCGVEEERAVENLMMLQNTLPIARCAAKYGHRRRDGRVSFIPLGPSELVMRGNLECFLR